MKNARSTPRIPPAAPLLFLGLLSLLAGAWTGLLRLGWDWPAWRTGASVSHGPLMVSAFLGALINLERGVALAPLARPRQRPLLYLPALLSGLGGLMLIFGLGGGLGPALLVAGSLGLVWLMTRIYRLHPALYNAIIWLGAVSWLAGNILWLGGMALFQVALWWAGFLFFTIAGERLELSRLLKLSGRVRATLLAALCIFVIGLALGLINAAWGMFWVGLGMALAAIWLLRYDMARRRVRAGGQAQFVAIALLVGYAWLLISGLLFMIYRGVPAGPKYDAMLHAFFLGFVFSMIFAHAPIVFPAVLSRAMRFSPSFYIHLTLLQISLLLRLAGDLLNMPLARQWGGLLNAITLLLFLLITMIAVRRGGQKEVAT
ncbi:MAG: hypothetical protein GXP42_16330 [Chloroflexi bacterium]|nr:hypothetical protein [Chloroflexota bacterium]